MSNQNNYFTALILSFRIRTESGGNGLSQKNFRSPNQKSCEVSTQPCHDNIIAVPYSMVWYGTNIKSFFIFFPYLTGSFASAFNCRSLKVDLLITCLEKKRKKDMLVRFGMKQLQKSPVSRLLLSNRGARLGSTVIVGKNDVIARGMSTEIASRLYENNTFDHQIPQPPPQEWSTFDGKLPILTQPENLQHGGVLGQYGDTPRTSVLMELTDRVGVLHDVLRYFWKYDVNICRIESRPAKQASPTGQLRAFDFFVDMEGSPSDENVGKLLDALRPMTDKLLILDEKVRLYGERKQNRYCSSHAYNLTCHDAGSLTWIMSTC